MCEIGIFAEAARHGFEDVAEGFAGVGGGDDGLLDVVIQRLPALIEDRLEEARLRLKIADKLRLGGSRLAGDARRRGLLEPMSAKQRLAGIKESLTRRLGSLGFGRHCA